MPFSIYILAGNRVEANQYIHDKAFLRRECFIIDQNCIPIGVYNIKVFCFGSWRSRSDLQDIYQELGRIGADLFEEANGIFWQQPMPSPSSYPGFYRASQWKNQYQSRYQYQTGGQTQQMSIKCRIWWDVSLNSYVVSSAYSDKLVNGLKQFIPAGARDYDPQTKFWYIGEQYGPFVQQCAEAAFGVGAVSFTSKNVAQQAGSQQAYQGSKTASLTSNPQTTEDCVVAFFNLISYEAAKKAYLVASATLHPDKPTGDGQKMTRLNELWQRLEKEFFKR